MIKNGCVLMARIEKKNDNTIIYFPENLNEDERNLAKGLSEKFTKDFYEGLMHSLEEQLLFLPDVAFHKYIQDHLRSIFVMGYDEAAKRFKIKTEENKEKQ